MMRRTVTTLLVALASGGAMSLNSHAEQQKRPAEKEKPKTYQGLSATLTVAGAGCRVDNALELSVTLASAGGAHRLFNPFFNGLVEQPGRLLIRDSDGKIVNRVLDFQEGSRRTPGQGDYVTLPGDGFVGKKLAVYPSRKGEGGESLPPGDYTMQLVLYGTLLSLDGEAATREIVTSERVAFRIVK